MKKVLYIILLAAELLIGVITMGLVYSGLGWIPCIAVAAILAAILVPLLRRLGRQKREGDTAGAKKTRRHIALAMLFPTAVALTAALIVIIELLIYFG